MAVALILGGCSSMGLQDSEPLPLEAWCAGQSTDSCLAALTLLHWPPEQELCGVAVTELTVSLYDLCP